MNIFTFKKTYDTIPDPKISNIDKPKEYGTYVTEPIKPITNNQISQNIYERQKSSNKSKTKQITNKINSPDKSIDIDKEKQSLQKEREELNKLRQQYEEDRKLLDLPWNASIIDIDKERTKNELEKKRLQ